MKEHKNEGDSNLMTVKNTLIWIALIFIFSILISCTSEKVEENRTEDLKSKVIEAMNKQKEINNYRFSGEMNLNLNMNDSSSSQNPLTAGLLSMLSHSVIQWQGIAQKSPTELEIDLIIRPHASDLIINIPAMIKDTKLYFNMPMLTLHSNEYLFFELGNESNFSFTNMMINVALAIDNNYYERTKSLEEITETITVQITQDSVYTFIQSLQDQFPFLSETNILNIQTMELTEPAYISITMNDEGYIINQKIKLHYSENTLALQFSMDDINKSVPFEKETPEETRSFDDILQLLLP